MRSLKRLVNPLVETQSNARGTAFTIPLASRATGLLFSTLLQMLPCQESRNTLLVYSVNLVVSLMKEENPKIIQNMNSVM